MSTKAAMKLQAVSTVATSAIDISNLPHCIEEIRESALNTDPGPSDPTSFSELITRLEFARTKLPPLYRLTVADPFRKKLEEIGEHSFNQILLRDPQREGTGGLMMDIAHAVLQNGEQYEALATDAFQEVISDLYDGLLSAEDRHGAAPPDQEVTAPLVKWGSPDAGPYTWPVDASSNFDIGCAIVSMPPGNANQGLLAWTALAHETAGHDVIHANKGLEEELQDTVHSALMHSQRTAHLADYWATRIDETASDVFGILNMGPAVGIGLIGYFRGLNAAYEGTARLRNDGPADDPHPADVLRGFLASATIRLLAFQGAPAWAEAVEHETRKDANGITIEGREVSAEDSLQSAQTVAKAITQTRLKTLARHRFIDIQNWRDADERIVAQLRRSFSRVQAIPTEVASGMYAAHAVAAAALAALCNGADISATFKRMLRVLKTMHDANVSWGPLYVRHPSNIFRNVAYIRPSDGSKAN